MSETTYDGMFGGSGVWIFALLILLLIGGGGFGLGNGNALSQADLQRAVDLNSIQEGQSQIRNDVQRTAYEGIAATKDASYNNLSEVRDVQSAIAVGFANQQNCCCETNRNIDSVRYDTAQMIANSDAKNTANTQAILDRMAANREADLMQRINQLELQQAVCGIPKASPFGYNLVPSMSYYGTGTVIA